MHYKYFILFLLSALLMGSCKEEPSQVTNKKSVKIAKAAGPQPGCLHCHAKVSLDQHHNLSCTRCHEGDNTAIEKKTAHAGLIKEPAGPENMAKKCGKCHGGQIQSCAGSLHFTLKNAINLTRRHFGATDTLKSLTAIPLKEEKPALSLVDDMLRRRCLRCHVYSKGDDYPYINRGAGCASCHLQFSGGRLTSHHFLKAPGDWQCISCHYANHVGADYYGQFEHDLNSEYQTPYTTSEPYFRPYGVEVHDLVPDIHQEKGMICIDCHSGKNLKTNSTSLTRSLRFAPLTRSLRFAPLTCLSCHGWQPGDSAPTRDNLKIIKGKLILTDRSGRNHPVSSLHHPAHKKYGKQVDCQVCHAQWSFNDQGTYMLRSETDDFEMMDRMIVQSSSWVEHLLEHNINTDEDEIDPAMPDGITGKIRPGIWYMGYGQRRWENIIIRRDSDGVIKVFRPILDLHLFAVDEKGKVVFDNLTGKGDGLLPYTPHTTGLAGLFYLERFAHLLDEDTRTRP
jgi:hypothetical protein